jgi:ribosomal protein L23
MLLSPRISEKAYQSAAGNIYVFDVPLAANKAEVTKALTTEYPDVKIGDVRLLITKGKVKAVNKGKHARPGQTTHQNTKKAYVTLTEGSIAVAAFEQSDYSEAEAAQAETATEAKVSRKVSAGEETKKAGLFARRRTGNRGDK